MRQPNSIAIGDARGEKLAHLCMVRSQGEDSY